MNKQIRSRTWKYFWEQKGDEISYILFILFLIWSITGLFFQLGWICEGWVNNETCVTYETWFPIWMMISGIITTGIWIMIGLVYWIQTNWEEASKKAKKDFKGGK